VHPGVPVKDYLVFSTLKSDSKQEDESNNSSQLCIYRMPTDAEIEKEKAKGEP
jgi:hypothetical protein